MKPSRPELLSNAVTTQIYMVICVVMHAGFDITPRWLSAAFSVATGAFLGTYLHILLVGSLDDIVFEFDEDEDEDW